MPAFSQPASTTRPSTPAVLRPALTSVTRRTLSRAAERDRSISFCRLRTLLRSPACDAVKIRCRRRRTSSSAWRQSTASQAETASSGPFATIVAPACPSVPVSSVFVSVTGPPDRVSALPGPGTRPGIRPVIRHGQRRGQPSCPGFLLPFGHRHSLLGHPVPARELGLPCGRLTGHYLAPGPGRGFHVSHLRDTTGVGALSTPGTAVLSPAGCRARPAPAASQRPVPAPRSRIPPAGPLITRHQRGFTRFTRPVCPWPVASRMGREALGLSPVLRTPPLPAAHDRAGPGREHAPGTTRPT